eukprot:TRINITY_DN18607_c0_g1_i1.p1 TRINITY_DN18607_c0_g1~~TRINITY_DN18607_c0_g1_i1.p1  ORF type:complete len:276 (+),score=59.37 TRINITY_DN18607_c0_g1_i1:48-830(+)
MCIVFLSYGYHSKYKLVLLVNRDEFLDRPTHPTEFWEGSDILGSKDLKSNGLQFGLTKTGRFAILTNYRMELNVPPPKYSRGFLVLEFLRGNQTPQEYINHIQPNGADYDGFNLIVGNMEDIWYYSNRLPDLKPIRLTPSKIYGLSNHLLDTPWPKVEAGKDLLSQIDDPTFANCFEILQDKAKAPEHLVPITEYGFDAEYDMSSIFVVPFTRSPLCKQFGTRCQHVVLVDQQNQVSFADRFYDQQSNIWQEKTFQFKIQ